MAVHGTVAPGSPIDATIEVPRRRRRRRGPEPVRAYERVRITERRSLLPVPVEATKYLGASACRADAPMELTAKLEGSGGAIPLSAEGTLKDERLMARVSSARVTPEAALATDPSAPPRPAALGAGDGRRSASDLAVTAHVAVLDPLVAGDAVTGEVTAHARLDALDPKRITAEVRIAELDPRAFVGTAPAARVSAEARGEIHLDEEGGPRAIAEAATEPFLVAGQRVPATARATSRGAARCGPRRRSTSPARPSRRASPARRRGCSSSRRRARSRRSARCSASRAASTAAPALHVEGALRTTRSTPRRPCASPGSASGPICSSGAARSGPGQRGPRQAHDRRRVPRSDLRAQQYAFRQRGGERRGACHGAARPRVAGQRGAPIVGLGPPRSAAERGAAARAEVARGENEVTAQAARVAWDRGIALRGPALRGDGGGSFEGSLSLAGDEIEGDLRGTALDLARIADITGAPLGIGGLANLDVSVHGRGARRAGRVQIELEDGSVPGVRRGSR